MEDAVNPTMRIGNCFEDGKPAKGFVRMVRYGQRRLGEYSYNVFDPSVETGIGERKTVDEAARFFARTKSAWTPTFEPPTDPRATTGANMFAVLDGIGPQGEGPEYHTRQTFGYYPQEMEKGRSWGKNDDTTESVGLSFDLYTTGAGTAWFDNSMFLYSNLLWEFSPDGGNKWYQWYDLPNKAYSRMTLPRPTNTLKARVMSNNPEEWLQAFALIPQPDYQLGTPDAFTWNTADGESDFAVSIVGYATWTEAKGGNGVFVYYIYADDELVGKTRLTSYQLENYDPSKTYTVSAIDSSGVALDPHIKELKINRLGATDYVSYTNEFYATYVIGDIRYDTRNGSSAATWTISNTTAFRMTVGKTCSVDYVAAGTATLTVKVNQSTATLAITSSLAAITAFDPGYFYYSDAQGSMDGAEFYLPSASFGAAIWSTSSYVLLNPHLSLSTGDVKSVHDKYMSAYKPTFSKTLTDFETVAGNDYLVHWKGTATTSNNTLGITFPGVAAKTARFNAIASYADVYYVGPDGLRVTDQLNMIGVQARTIHVSAYVIYEGEASYDLSVLPTAFISSVKVNGFYPGSETAQTGITATVGKDIALTFPASIDLSHGEIVVTYKSAVGGSTTHTINYMYSFF